MIERPAGAPCMHLKTTTVLSDRFLRYIFCQRCFRYYTISDVTAAIEAFAAGCRA